MILTGHSLGAAVSALTYIQLVKNYQDMDMEFINLSFACPMFGHMDLENWVQGIALRQLYTVNVSFIISATFSPVPFSDLLQLYLLEHLKFVYSRYGSESGKSELEKVFF